MGLTGYDAGLAAPVEPQRCPICGAWLDSGDDFLMLDAAGWAAGCSRCLRRVWAQDYAARLGRRSADGPGIF